MIKRNPGRWSGLLHSMLALALLLAPFSSHEHPTGRFTRESSGFGMIASAAGDQDGDGKQDLLIGEDLGAAASLWVLSGKDGSTLRTFLVDHRPTARVRIQGGTDMDGDRVPDFLACMRDKQRVGADELLLLSGRDGRIVWRQSIPEASGCTPDSCRIIPDVDGDGRSDVAVLCPRVGAGRSSLRRIAGRTGEPIDEFAFENASDSPSGGILELEDLDHDGRLEFAVMLDGKKGMRPLLRAFTFGNSTSIWERPSATEWGGAFLSLALLGDVDGDGTRDVLAGGRDSVDVISGRSGRLLRHIEPPHESDSRSGFGWAVASAGDANGDGVCDLIVAEPEYGLTGRVRAFSGDDAQEIWAHTPTLESEIHNYGYQLVEIGDLDGDGASEVLVGSWESPAAQPGYAAVLSGKTGKTRLAFRRSGEGVVAFRASDFELR